MCEVAKPEMTMKTRCKPGDLALVVFDTPACADNVGRVVRVQGPLAFNCAYDKHCWLVEPVVQSPYAVEEKAGVRRAVVLFDHRIEHPDSWLVPIARRSPKARAAKLQLQQKPLKQLSVTPENEALMHERQFDDMALVGAGARAPTTLAACGSSSRTWIAASACRCAEHASQTAA
jgi:hypothetical protein